MQFRRIQNQSILSKLEEMTNDWSINFPPNFLHMQMWFQLSQNSVWDQNTNQLLGNFPPIISTTARLCKLQENAPPIKSHNL